jgi:hypothetical protein
MKLRHIIIFLICNLSLNYGHSKAPSTFGQLKIEIERISKKNLMDFVTGLVKSSAPSRMVGKVGHQAAVDYLTNEIKKIDPKSSGSLKIVKFSPDIEEGQQFYQRDFDQKLEGKVPATHPEYKKWLNFTLHMKENVQKLSSMQGTNIIWEKMGINSDKVLVITAHYDTVSHDPNTLLIKANESMPGANYNASGVGVALAIIKLLSQLEFNYSVQVVLLDMQGFGFLGSHQHSRDLKISGKNILGVINLEMLGQDTSFFDKTKQTGNMIAYTRALTAEEQWVARLSQYGKQFTEKVTFENRPKGFENSDNIRYWEQNFLSATFTQNWEEDFNAKFFQTSQDTPETLNQDTLYHAYKYLAGAVGSTLLDLTK